MTEKNIQLATEKDVAALVQLINSAYRGNIARKGWTHEADLIEGEERINEPALLKLLSLPGNAMIIIRDVDDVKGCVMLEKQDDYYYLGMLTVAPHLQTQGIGKQLLDLAEAYVQEQGIHKIVMTVISIRHELLAFYQRRGYTFTGIKKPFPTGEGVGVPKQPLEFVVLEKQL